MKFFAQFRTAWLVAAVLTGLVLLYAGRQLAGWPAPQVTYYNAGVTAYEQGDMKNAVALFDRSLAAYKAEANASWLHRFTYPRPSAEYAALAHFHKGKALIQARQAELGVEAFKESIRAFDLAADDEKLQPGQVKALREKQLIVQYDLEMLYKSRPDIAQGEGKGKGKGKGQGQGQDGKRAPGQDPGSQPGKGRPDDI